MDHGSVIGEYLLIEVILGWPLFLLGSLSLAAYLRLLKHEKWSIVTLAVGMAWPLSIVSALVVWRYWPAFLQGPMWASYVHAPTLVGSLVAFALVGWCVSSALFARLRVTNAP